MGAECALIEFLSIYKISALKVLSLLLLLLLLRLMMTDDGLVMNRAPMTTVIVYWPYGRKGLLSSEIGRGNLSR